MGGMRLRRCGSNEGGRRTAEQCTSTTEETRLPLLGARVKLSVSDRGQAGRMLWEQNGTAGGSGITLPKIGSQ